jgi:predicted transcriptional regulator
MRHEHKEGRHNQMSVRLDPETFAAVERVAEERARSPTNVVRTVLADLACNCCSAPRALF